MALPHRTAPSGFSRSQMSSPRLSPLESHTTLSPKHFYETIRLSKEENVWRCMHTADYPEPVLGARRIRVELSSTKGLSLFTQRANQMLESLQRPEDTFLTKSTSAGLFSPTNNKLPSESDFKRAIEKLGRVYAQGGVDSLKLSLQEGKTHELTLEPDEKMYARISLQAQLCPLVVNINRSRGRMVAYVSKTVQEPMEMICDAKVTGDRIWVSDPGIRFRSNTLYICFAAIEECVFSMNIQFGQKKRAITKDKWKPETLSSPNDEWEQVFGTFIDHKPKFSKNFIAKNRIMQRAASPEIVSYHLEKIMTIDIRRKEAVKRWHDQLNLKKKRALDLLNRQQLKEIERQKQMEIAKEKGFIAGIQQKWLAIVWSLKSCDCLLDKFIIRKAQIAIEGRKITAARKLQRAYRRHMHFSNGNQLSLLRGALSLKLAVRNLSNIDGPTHTSSLFSLIHLSAKHASVPIQFSEFHQRSTFHTVSFVQSIWRSVLQRHKSAFEQLIALWNSCMATAISTASKRKPTVVRGKKVKENPTLRYLNITSVTRNQILGAHFEIARNRLLQECREYVESMKSGARDRAAPDFRCVPTSEEMVKMIEKAADSTQQQPTD